jgi:Ca-activated chloride channel family protein
MPVEIDEKTLREIATRTGGSYFRATDGESLANIYGEIDRLERTELNEVRFLEYNELYAAFVAAGLAVAFVAFLLRATILRRLP